MAATSSIPIKETVYSGPAIETVYRGPAASSGQSQVSSNTVYDPSRQQTRSAGKSAPGQAMTPEVKRASVRFFIISALSLVQFIAYRDTRPDTAMGGLMIAVVFAVIGIFAMRMSKAAFIIGMLLYGADTGMLVLAGMNHGFAAVGWPVIVHGIIMFRLISGYESISKMKAA